MADEASVQAESGTQEAAPAPSDIQVETPNDVEGLSVEFESLFEGEDVSEDELMGASEEEGKPTDEGSETQTSSKKDDGDAASSQPKDAKQDGEASEDKKAAETKDDGEGEESKPPKGFVPIQALHQERSQRQTLATELQQMKAELEALRAGKDTTGQGKDAKAGEEFKVLSEEEFNELLEDDPVEAIKYDRRLRAYEAAQEEAKKAQQTEAELVNQSVTRMSEIVPGLYDENSDINQRLTDFAIENGFTDLDGLAMVTDPRTKVINPNTGKPVVLGETAAHLVTMLHNVFQKMSAPNTEANAEDTGKLTKQIEAEVVKNVLSKIKQPTGEEHRSIGDAPGDAKIDIDTPVLTEEEFAKLPKDKQKRLLGG
jgi:hypothetical protein